MMDCYIVTFYSHFDAISFKRGFEKLGVSVQLCPVPRQLSSSCGTCAQFHYAKNPAPDIRGEYELLVKKEGNQYITLVCNN